jgi:diguanylate cyclase (GGDEF)-like protein
MSIDHSSKITRQIYTGFGLIVLLIAFLGAISLIEINYLGSLTTTVYNHPLKVSNSALSARVSVVSMHRYMKDVVLAEDHESFEQAINKVETEEKQVLLNLDVIKKLILGSEGESLERKARQTFLAWEPIRAEVIQLVKNGDIKKAAQITQRRGADHEFELAQQMLNLASYAQGKADGFIQQSFQAKKNFSILTVIAVFSGTIISILIGAFTLKKVLKSHQARINIDSDLRKANKRLQELASTDSLTGVLNRRAFMKEAMNKFDLAKRYQRPLSLLMLDVDHFKKVNDTYGHQTGDHVLTQLSAVMKDSLRSTDIISRIGGEEFAIILPETSLEKTIEFTERLLNTIRNTKINVEPDTSFNITVSIGVATVPPVSSGLDAVMKKADDALYKAKSEGRDRCCGALIYK